jgi:hypothetical protein
MFNMQQVESKFASRFIATVGQGITQHRVSSLDILVGKETFPVENAMLVACKKARKLMEDFTACFMCSFSLLDMTIHH